MNKIIISIIVIIVVAVVAVALITQKKEAGSETEIGEETFGGSLYQQIEKQKEATEMPETNPFKAETNPLKGVKTNPFE